MAAAARMYPRGFCARFASAARAFQDKNAGAAAVFSRGYFGAGRWWSPRQGSGAPPPPLLARSAVFDPDTLRRSDRRPWAAARAACLLFLFAEHLSEKGEGGRWVYRLDAVKRLHKSFVIAPRLPL